MKPTPDPITEIDTWYKRGLLTHAESLRLENECKARCENCRIWPGAARVRGRLLCAECAIPHLKAREVAA